MEYTKGEWTQFKDMSGLKEFPEGHIQIAGNNQRDNIAIIPKRWNNHKANAHLISAAPLLYEALKEALEYIEGTYEEFLNQMEWKPKLELQIKQALAKAEGRERSK